MEFTARHHSGAKNFEFASKFSEDVFTPGLILVYGVYLTMGVTGGGGANAPPVFFSA